MSYMTIEILVQETKLQVQELLKYLPMLELKGFVEKAADGGFKTITLKKIKKYLKFD